MCGDQQDDIDIKEDKKIIIEQKLIKNIISNSTREIEEETCLAYSEKRN